ncbi:hypothetical protein PEC301653_03450 [Pectobacterium carotovorum subsp. carotovorum]|nr:hypothetical protein PEC301653_03450 [Pectobacterium carotovorum subsp. carotovorum]
MAGKKPQETTESTESVGEIKLPEKTCFIIMPIADHPDYEAGHFTRVYEYLIKPACIAAGYKPIRADDSKASHMIMHDILKKIIDCDMAICDLSSKNANVFYELGLRQAFNKKTILITDGKEKAPFDLAGFRYVPYSPILRVDTVKRDINEVEKMLKETELAPDNDVNSIVKLLEIKPANIKDVDLDTHDSVIFEMLLSIKDQISTNQKTILKNPFVGENDWANMTTPQEEIDFPKILIGSTFDFLAKNYPQELYQLEYSMSGNKIGRLARIDRYDITFTILNDGKRKSTFMSNTYENRVQIISNNLF